MLFQVWVTPSPSPSPAPKIDFQVLAFCLLLETTISKMITKSGFDARIWKWKSDRSYKSFLE
jgi:hypothetical protein